MMAICIESDLLRILINASYTTIMGVEDKDNKISFGYLHFQALDYCYCCCILRKIYHEINVLAIILKSMKFFYF